MAEEHRHKDMEDNATGIAIRLRSLEHVVGGNGQPGIKQDLDTLKTVAAQARIMGAAGPVLIALAVGFFSYFLFGRLEKMEHWQENWAANGELRVDVQQNERIEVLNKKLMAHVNGGGHKEVIGTIAEIKTINSGLKKNNVRIEARVKELYKRTDKTRESLATTKSVITGISSNVAGQIRSLDAMRNVDLQNISMITKLLWDKAFPEGKGFPNRFFYSKDIPSQAVIDTTPDFGN